MIRNKEIKNLKKDDLRINYVDEELPQKIENSYETAHRNKKQEANKN